MSGRSLSGVFVGFDRDGTLDLPGRPVPRAVLDHCERLAAEGVTLFIASGKSMSFLDQYVEALGLELPLLCAENGGHIRLPSGQEVVVPPSAELQSFAALVADLPLPPCAPEPKRSIWSRKFGDRATEAASILTAFVRARGWNLEVLCHPDVDGGLDVVPPTIHKGLVVPFLRAGSVTHFVGDSYNDLPLMENPMVIPHCPANAKSEVKAVVSQRGGIVATLDCGHGVAEILSHLFR